MPAQSCGWSVSEVRCEDILERGNRFVYLAAVEEREGDVALQLVLVRALQEQRAVVEVDGHVVLLVDEHDARRLLEELAAVEVLLLVENL